MSADEFTRRVEGMQRALRRFLLALCCGDGAMADDIAQEALIKAYLNIESLADPARFGSWLHSIAYRIFLNHKRAERPMESYDTLIHTPSAHQADEAFRYQALYAALDRIPPRERSSILLFYMEGYSAKEIAEITDSTENAVKQQLSRGRNHLRDLL